MKQATYLVVALFLLFLKAEQSAVAQYPNIRVSNPTSTSPEEVTVSINPRDPRLLAAGANIWISYLSTDAGQHWSEQSLTSPSFGVWGDPCVIFDALGNLYYAHLSNPPSGGYWIDRIVVQKSTDGGSSWNDGAGIGYNPPRKQQDKEWLAADMTYSPYRNNLYLAWTEFDSYGSSLPADSTRILFSRSTDGGVVWSSPVRVSDTGGNCVDADSTVEGAVPAVGPGGEVYLSWSGPLGIVFDKSLDGGQTFGQDQVVTSQPGGWDFGVSGIYRVNGMPVTACDAGNSPFRGNIYINWSDKRNGDTNADVFFMRSTDGGGTWGPVLRVNDDATAREQFFTWMTVDQTTGNIYVVFYDRRNTGGDSTEVFLATSTDGGESFMNIRISDSPFSPRASVFFGDYTNIAARNGTAYPIWMRLDSTKLSVWTVRFHDASVIASPMHAGWNMVSVPAATRSNSGSVLFPNASGGLYEYFTGTYRSADSLILGGGYWLKYSHEEVFYAAGDSILTDSIPLAPRWNMIGSISVPVPVSNLVSDPPGLVLSPFFYYDGSGYSTDDTIRPGRGYWVKSPVAARLILSSGALRTETGKVNILSSSEEPPPPPGMHVSDLTPGSIRLYQNYPNPFNPSTVIRYDLPAREHVRLRVFDLLGREVKTLIDEVQGSGSRSVEFNGSGLASGIYLYQLNAGETLLTGLMALLR